MPRKIIHLDLDAFFCSVEELRDPGLRGKAFAVGGLPEERGVVASCSYAARTCGVHSAMPMARAVKLCPGLIVISSRHGVYSQASAQVMDRLRQLTPLIEQISIDEAFLDVTDLPESGEQIARRLQAKINDELKLPCSLGVASNKLVAKIATDVGKGGARKGSPPNAITVIPPGEEAAFLAPLPAQALWGVGPKTAQRLTEMGIRTIGELAAWPVEDLARQFGKFGYDLSRHAQGISESQIVTEHAAKSISQETTFVKDINNPEKLRQTLIELSQGVGKQLRRDKFFGSTVKLKLRWPDFTTVTRQVSLKQPTDQDKEIFEAAWGLFNTLWRPRMAVRLLGVGVSRLGPAVRQLSLFDQTYKKDARLQATLDELRERFGDKVVRRGSDLNSKKTR
ncbi:MAG TPA: DNA polymerase IV [Anaerolineales bacterium]